MRWQTLIYAVLLASINSCGQEDSLPGQKQKGSTNEVDQQVEDKTPPKFTVPPKLENITSTTADVVFVLDEKATGSLVVRAANTLGLSHAQINESEDSYPIETKAFETKRILLKDLKAGTPLSVVITVQDIAGNLIEEPLYQSFTTASLTNPITLTGAPPPMLQGVYWKFTPNNLPDHCKLIVTSGPSWIKPSQDGGSVEATPRWESTPGLSEASDVGNRVDFTLKSVGENCEDTAEFVTTVKGDPLYKYSWHINQETENYFSWFGAPKGKFKSLYAKELGLLTGKGVTITIVDSGMQMTHPDLKNNVDAENSINLDPLIGLGCAVCEDQDTTPPLEEGQYGDQGTNIAGIIAAEGWNNIGSRGIAPKAKISAYNMTAPRFVNEIAEPDFMRIPQLKAHIISHTAVSSESVLTEAQPFDFDNYDTAQKSKVRVGRDRKGTIFLKSSGQLGQLDGNSAMDQMNVTSWGMVIGSYNLLNTRSLNSSGGSNLWVAAPGGEAGWQSDYRKLDENLSLLNYYPSLVSTDLYNPDFPCATGFAKHPKYFNDLDRELMFQHSLGRSSGFNMGWHADNRLCQYNASTPSTPAATAIVTGMAALLLEYNPQLTWRDIKQIIAKSADPINEDVLPVLTTVEANPYVKTLGWVRNGAGFNFHNWYGFGAINLEKAIELANPDTYQPLPEQHDSNWQLTGNGGSIPPADISGHVSEFFQVKDFIIESVQIRVNITHDDVSHIGIELVSPSGTKSILKSIRDGAKLQNLEDYVFLSNAFYGERSRGQWQLKVVDGKTGKPTGSLNNWFLRVTGHYANGAIR